MLPALAQANDWTGGYVGAQLGYGDVSWETWYTQASYRPLESKWEWVARYGDFTSPHASQNQEQWALGTNYLFSNNFVGKLTYEFNDGLAGRETDDDRVLFQLAYGF